MPIIAPVMKRVLLISALVLSTACSFAHGRDSLLVLDWNLENFFDFKDYKGDRRWTSKRFYLKAEGIAKTAFCVADREGRMPDLMTFQEVGERSVLSRLSGGTQLRKAGYGIVHFDSPDPRGIDCGLLYRKETLRLSESKPFHLCDSSGAVMKTRDLLFARFENRSGMPVAVLVCHLPSKLRQGAAERRKTAFARVNQVCDSIWNRAEVPIFAVGDYNEQMPWADTSETKGSLKYNGVWERIDGVAACRGVRAKERVFDAPFLLERDSAHGGLKPRRTFSGPRYLGGISDHLPVIAWIYY